VICTHKLTHTHAYMRAQQSVVTTARFNRTLLLLPLVTVLNLVLHINVRYNCLSASLQSAVTCCICSQLPSCCLLSTDTNMRNDEDIAGHQQCTICATYIPKSTAHVLQSTASTANYSSMNNQLHLCTCRAPDYAGLTLRMLRACVVFCIT
jgi:hypothetical protein